MIINGVEIKPGMVLCGCENNNYTILIVIPYNSNSIAFVNVSNGGWSLYYTTFLSNIEEIRGCPTNGNLKGGKILWKKPEEIILTVGDIRTKFNIPKNVKIIIK